MPPAQSLYLLGFLHFRPIPTAHVPKCPLRRAEMRPLRKRGTDALWRVPARRGMLYAFKCAA